LTAKSLLELFRAIAIAAGPRLDPVFVATIPTGMGVFDAEQMEIFLPIRAFLSERRIAKAALDPGRHAVFTYPRLIHVVQILVAGDRALAERSTFNCAEEITFLSSLQLGFYPIAHSKDNITNLHDAQISSGDGV
jgi:hypothetical protein